MSPRFRRRVSRKFFCTVVAVLVSTVPAAAATLTVPGQYPTIQAAINAAQNSDRIEVAAGTYYENLVWSTKLLTLVGAGAQTTVIDGRNTGRCLEMTNVPSGARVEGFTFTHGRGWTIFSQTGGALMLTSSSPTIAYNVIRDSVAGSGGGIMLFKSDATLVGNLIVGNTGSLNAGGVDISSGAPLLVSNTIDSNVTGGSAGGVRVYGLSAAGLAPTFINDTVTRNTAHDSAGGAGMFFWSTAGRVVNTTVAGNSGGGICQSAPTKGTLEIVNSIIWANPGPNGVAGYDFRSLLGPFLISHSNVGPGGSMAQILSTQGNISMDPVFVNLATGDVHVLPGSPAVDTGTIDIPDLPPTDKDGGPRVFGATVDMGAYELSGPSDSTPPVITPTVVGTLGRDGWYVSAVQISWTVSDAESAVTSTADCDPITVDQDTAGRTFTCSASSAGGTRSVSVTIKRDATPPAAACSMAPSLLWPPDRRLVPVSALVTVTDAIGASVVLDAVRSSEAESAAGDILGFAVGTGGLSGLLRAARLGVTDGRVYTFTFGVSDPAGNRTPCQATVLVPHSQSQKK